jgi:hypothetical protein
MKEIVLVRLAIDPQTGAVDPTDFRPWSNDDLPLLPAPWFKRDDNFDEPEEA